MARFIDIGALLPPLEEGHQRFRRDEQNDDRLDHTHDFETDIGVAFHELRAGPQISVEQTGEGHNKHIQSRKQSDHHPFKCQPNRDAQDQFPVDAVGQVHAREASHDPH